MSRPRSSNLVRPISRSAALSATALLLLLVAACGRSAPSGPQAHATATPGASRLAWHAATVPGGGIVTYPEGVVTVAPGDGNIAYMCIANGSARVAIWATHDRAAHWMYVGDISVATGTNQCYPTIDGLQPNTVVVAVIAAKLGANPPVGNYTSYVTFDGGGTWRKLSAQQPYFALQISTLAGVIYGYLRVASGPQDEEVPELATSSDQMRTWHPILRPTWDVGGFNGIAFWLNPANGGLLVKDIDAFWSSGDAGAHWSKISVPGMASPSENVVVQAPVAGESWRLCAANDDDRNLKNPRPNTLTCSMNGGNTWISLPGLNVSFTNAKGTFVWPTDVFAWADDGALLAMSSDSYHMKVYRMMPDARQWQSLGPEPGPSASVQFYPGPGGDVLWAWTNAGLFTASYP